MNHGRLYAILFFVSIGLGMVFPLQVSKKHGSIDAVSSSQIPKNKRREKSEKSSDFASSSDLARYLGDLNKIDGVEKALLQFSRFNASSSRVDRAMGTALIAQAAAQDPQKVFDYFKGDWRRIPQGAKETLFNVWVKLEPERAISEVSSQRNGAFKQEAEALLFTAFCEKAPSKALEIMNKSGASISNIANFTSLDPSYQIFFNMSITDRSKCLSSLDLISDPKMRENALQGMVRGIARTNILDSINFASSIQDKDMRKSLVGTAFQEGLSIDPEAAISLLKESGSYLKENERSEILKSNIGPLLAYKADENFDLVMSSVASAVDRQKVEEVMLNQLLASDPSMAYSKILKYHPEVLSEKEAIQGLSPELQALALQAKGASDPKSLVEWAQKNQGVVSNKILQQALAKAGRVDPQSILEFATQNIPGASQQNFAGDVLSQWFQDDPQKAALWTKEHLTSDSSLTETLAERTVSDFIRKSPETFLQSFSQEDYINAKNLQDFQIATLQWSLKDPAAAAAWADNLGAGQLHDAAIEQISKNWVEQDSMSASTWIKALPYGEARQVAIRNMVNYLEKVDPVAAADWQGELDSKPQKNQ
ncbi:hypothetical protein KBB96_03310 [Luteolibacter ambystomatis]|uniref:Uncharacterized protein n=1 Tax=Luteolibacter ambystomatis TaxID=2824561 RepID=A0A975PFB2_9BACT|nr:hypothetical protein [Luteolibacter ambystomatis]QUE51923.1 hypothetical protein KBB96_03310 [Luteolibacter ambystomatis]